MISDAYLLTYRMQRLIDEVRGQPCMTIEHAEEFRELGAKIFDAVQDSQQKKEAAALAKEMSPEPTVRVLLRNVTGGGQFFDWPADHPALKD